MEGPSPPCKKEVWGNASDGVAAAHGKLCVAGMSGTGSVLGLTAAVKSGRKNIDQIRFLSVYKGQET